MNTIGDRIKSVRISENLSQEEFGKRLNLSRSIISCYEKGLREITERSIKDIVREFNIDENWIYTGEGDMYHKMTEDEEFAYMIGALLVDDEEDKRKFIRLMLDLDESYWPIVTELIEGIKKRDEHLSKINNQKRDAD
ncbi:MULTISPECIES: helix-turn-helix domain-containing protein [Clostridium]|uniref:helix-turn-helix domain-containing protein n=1 Tax=Clostridium TaxID=1485 RepID=UPI0032EAEF83